MAAMVAEMVSVVGKRCIIVLDAYFAVGPVFLILRQILDDSGNHLLQYGLKLNLMGLFETMAESFEQTTIEIYGQYEEVSFLCLDLIWKPIKEKIRFVLVRDDSVCFILMCSDLTLSAQDIIRAYSYRFKIEVSFKVLKHLIGVFFYHFWTSAWPHIGKRNVSDLSAAGDPRSRRLIRQTTNAIEAFVNFGCIATGILQIVSLNFHETIWKKYLGWLRTVTSTIPSEEVVKSVIQEEYYHNFRFFSNSVIYRIIMSKSRKRKVDAMRFAA